MNLLPITQIPCGHNSRITIGRKILSLLQQQNNARLHSANKALTQPEFGLGGFSTSPYSLDLVLLECDCFHCLFNSIEGKSIKLGLLTFSTLNHQIHGIVEPSETWKLPSIGIDNMRNRLLINLYLTCMSNMNQIKMFTTAKKPYEFMHQSIRYEKDFGAKLWLMLQLLMADAISFTCFRIFYFIQFCF